MMILEAILRLKKLAEDCRKRNEKMNWLSRQVASGDEILVATGLQALNVTSDELALLECVQSILLLLMPDSDMWHNIMTIILQVECCKRYISTCEKEPFAKYDISNDQEHNLKQQLLEKTAMYGKPGEQQLLPLAAFQLALFKAKKNSQQNDVDTDTVFFEL